MLETSLRANAPDKVSILRGVAWLRTNNSFPCRSQRLIMRATYQVVRMKCRGPSSSRSVVPSQRFLKPNCKISGQIDISQYLFWQNVQSERERPWIQSDPMVSHAGRVVGRRHTRAATSAKEAGMAACPGLCSLRSLTLAPPPCCAFDIRRWPLRIRHGALWLGVAN
jgi:hypothetical protein